MHRHAPLGPLLAVAAAGVVLLHQVAYLVAHPDPVARAIAAQGHAHLWPMAQVLVPLGVAVAGWTMACRALRLLEGRPLSSSGLIVAHVGLFTLLEVGERVVRGGGVGDAFAEPAVWLGLVLAPLLGHLTALALRVGARLRPPATAAVDLFVPPAPAVALTPSSSVHVPTGVPGRVRARGPPVPSD